MYCVSLDAVVIYAATDYLRVMTFIASKKCPLGITLFFRKGGN